MQDAINDPDGLPGRKFRVEERLSGKLQRDPEFLDLGVWAADGSEGQEKTNWECMDASVRAAWLQVDGHARTWADAYGFLLLVFQNTRRRDYWRFPNPASFLTPLEWAKSVGPYARRTGLDRLVDRMKSIVSAIKGATATV